MSEIYLAVNQVLGTTYGHLQLVYDPDDTFDNGNELEVEVQGPFLGIGDWDVRPVQAMTLSGSSAYGRVTLAASQTPETVWELLTSARNFFAGRSIDYRLGLFGALEGQNSNTYIKTLAHISGLDIDGLVTAFLGTSVVSSLPGYARNVLFDHHAENDAPLPPIALTLTGTAGNDRMNGGKATDQLAGAAGDDTLRGFDGNDTLSGGDGDDTLLGDGGDDMLRGEAGDDGLQGHAGRDTLIGGAGHDVILGGDGDDTLQGEAGRDLLQGDNGNDLIEGGAQNDRAFGGMGADIIAGGSGRDRLFGEGDQDDMSGGAGNDLLRGGHADDTLAGNGGDDTLGGGGGRDRLTGGKGDDTLTGGGARDVFVFDGLRDQGDDTVTDFENGRDRIEVAGLTFADITIAGGADAMITLDGLTTIALTGVAAAQIDAADFLFT